MEGNLSKELLSRLSLTSIRQGQSRVPLSKPNHWQSGMRVTVIGFKTWLILCNWGGVSIPRGSLASKCYLNKISYISKE